MRLPFAPEAVAELEDAAARYERERAVVAVAHIRREPLYWSGRAP